MEWFVWKLEEVNKKKGNFLFYFFTKHKKKHNTSGYYVCYQYEEMIFTPSCH